MPNQFLSDEFGDIEDYFVTDYWLIDQFVGDQLFTWGRNDLGQLGDNTTTQRGIPVTTFAGGTTWKQVASGGYHTAAIKTDGSLWTWGRNNFGQLGDFSNTNRSTPVTTFAGGNDWKQVTCGGFQTAAIKTDGSLWTWGRNDFGTSLGTNNTGNKNTPVTTFSGGNNWKQVSMSNRSRHSAAIKTDGTLWIWGNGNNLGINLFGDANSRNTPVTTFVGGNNWKQVSVGYEFTAAVKTDGSLWTWGRGTEGQLGDNNAITRSTPVTTFAGGNNWKSVACSGHTAAIKTDGSLWTWGYNNSGQLGTSNTTWRSTPVTTFAGGNNWKQVSCGNRHTGAIKTDGTLWVWGSDDFNALGTNGAGADVPVTTFAGGNNWKQVSFGDVYSTAVKSGLNVDLS